MTATQSMYHRYHFFMENAGYVVGECATGAYQLAKAEELAESANLSVDWDWEEDYDLSWCECKGDNETCVRCGSRKYSSGRECASGALDGHDYHDHDVLYAYVKAGGVTLAGLGGIVDAIGTPYQRVVEAELLAEAIEELNRNEYTLPIA